MLMLIVLHKPFTLASMLYYIELCIPVKLGIASIAYRNRSTFIYLSAYLPFFFAVFIVRKREGGGVFKFWTKHGGGMESRSITQSAAALHLYRAKLERRVFH